MEQPQYNSENYSGSKYSEKSEIIANQQNDSLTVEDILEAGTFVQKVFNEDLPKLAAKAYKNTISALTPGFIKRQRAKKIHTKYIESAER
jgi:hypothetical protein